MSYPPSSWIDIKKQSEEVPYTCDDIIQVCAGEHRAPPLTRIETRCGNFRVSSVCHTVIPFLGKDSEVLAHLRERQASEMHKLQSAGSRQPLFGS